MPNSFDEVKTDWSAVQVVLPQYPVCNLLSSVDEGKTILLVEGETDFMKLRELIQGQ